MAFVLACIIVAMIVVAFASEQGRSSGVQYSRKHWKQNNREVVKVVTCPTCKGTGRVLKYFEDEGWSGMIDCPDCKAKGDDGKRIIWWWCKRCGNRVSTRPHVSGIQCSRCWHAGMRGQHMKRVG